MSFVENIDSIIAANANELLGAHETWEKIRIGEVSEVENGFAFKSEHFSAENDTPILRIRDILKGEVSTYYDGPHVSDVYAETGELVIGMDGDFNARLWPGQRALINQRVCKLIPNERYYSNRFLSYVLPGYLEAINEATSSVTVKHLSSSTILELPLPLPPRHEQERISNKLDELFSELDAGVASLKRARALLKKYRQAVLKAAVTGELTRDWRERHPEDSSGANTLSEIWEFRRRTANSADGQVPKPRLLYQADFWNLPEGWAWCSIDEAGDVQLGQQRAPQHHLGQHMRPYLRVANVLEDELDLADVKWMNFEPKELRKFELRPGDILINEGQSPDLLGRSAIYNGEIDGCCLQKTLLRFRAYPGVLPGFAQIVFRSYMHFGRFRKISRITTNIGHLTRVRFVAMEFPMPSTREQEEIVSRFEAIDTNIKYLERLLVDLGDGPLRQAILKAAFAGKLVPQDPNDEPASVLLERIRAERAAKPRPARGRRAIGPTKRHEDQLDLAFDRGDAA